MKQYQWVHLHVMHTVLWFTLEIKIIISANMWHALVSLLAGEAGWNKTVTSLCGT